MTFADKAAQGPVAACARLRRVGRTYSTGGKEPQTSPRAGPTTEHASGTVTGRGALTTTEPISRRFSPKPAEPIPSGVRVDAERLPDDGAG